jgi:hypothetical protein
MLAPPSLPVLTVVIVTTSSCAFISRFTGPSWEEHVDSLQRAQPPAHARLEDLTAFLDDLERSRRSMEERVKEPDRRQRLHRGYDDARAGWALRAIPGVENPDEAYFFAVRAWDQWRQGRARGEDREPPAAIVTARQKTAVARAAHHQSLFTSSLTYANPGSRGNCTFARAPFVKGARDEVNPALSYAFAGDEVIHVRCYPTTTVDKLPGHSGVFGALLEPTDDGVAQIPLVIGAVDRRVADHVDFQFPASKLRSFERRGIDVRFTLRYVYSNRDRVDLVVDSAGYLKLVDGLHDARVASSSFYWEAR